MPDVQERIGPMTSLCGAPGSFVMGLASASDLACIHTSSGHSPPIMMSISVAENGPGTADGFRRSAATGGPAGVGVRRTMMKTAPVSVGTAPSSQRMVPDA